MKSYFSSKFFIGNRTRLREACGDELIIIAANGLLQRAGDSAFSFTQDAYFWYLTGIDEPDVVLVMDGSEEYLILPEQSDYQKIFDVSAPENALARRAGIKTIYTRKEGWEKLGARLNKAKHIASVAPAPEYLDTYGMYTNPSRAALIKKLKSHRQGLEITDMSSWLARQRMIKQPEELTAIQSAIDITIASLKDAFSKNHKSEYELEADITHGFRRRCAAGHAFEPIVAAGKRACTLHNVANNEIFKSGEMVVVDVGAEVEHYAADITRTVNFGRLSARQRAVHKAVSEVQKYAIGLLKPGLTFNDYRRQTNQLMGEKLQELGLIKNPSPKKIHKYYPHSISHFLGLNVHDVGDYSRPLEPGTVLTVEPGIYIPKENIGVRIEDDVLITETGCEVLSAKLSGDLS